MWALIVILVLAVVLATLYYNRQHRHDIAGPHFHDPNGDNYRGTGAAGGGL